MTTIVTDAGRTLLAYLSANSLPLSFTRVVFGTGTASGSLEARTELVTPLAEGVYSVPIQQDDAIYVVVEFRSDLNGGLKESVNLTEYGLFANDQQGGEVLCIYSSFSAESVQAYQTDVNTIRDFQIVMPFAKGLTIDVVPPATAYMTSQDAKDLMDTCLAHGVQMDALTPCGLADEDLWLEDENGGYYCDFPRDDVTADYVPFLALLSGFKENAYQCGLDRIETFDGYLRLHCVKKTSLPIYGTCVLFHKGIDTPITYFEMPIATENTLGGVRASESVVVDDNGIASVTLTEDDFATEAEIEAAISEGLS